RKNSKILFDGKAILSYCKTAGCCFI
ncbi:uncharacterized protein METZ01_LOCUS245914, partial [marine metagenome]